MSFPRWYLHNAVDSPSQGRSPEPSPRGKGGRRWTRRLALLAGGILLLLAATGLLLYSYPPALAPILRWAGNNEALERVEYGPEISPDAALAKLRQLGRPGPGGARVTSVVLTEAELNAWLARLFQGNPGLDFYQWRIDSRGGVMEGATLLRYHEEEIPVSFQIHHTVRLVERGKIQLDPYKIKLGKVPVSEARFREEIWPRVAEQSPILQRLFYKPLFLFLPVEGIEVREGEVELSVAERGTAASLLHPEAIAGRGEWGGALVGSTGPSR